MASLVIEEKVRLSPRLLSMLTAVLENGPNGSTAAVVAVVSLGMELDGAEDIASSLDVAVVIMAVRRLDVELLAVPRKLFLPVAPPSG